MSDTEKTPIVEVVGVSKRFPGVFALNQVNFAVYPGEVVALIGENGAGKSTLMKTLGGLHRQDEGEIRVDGKPAEIRNVSDSLHLGISLIHQELNNLDNLDVGGNIFLGREPLTGGFLRLIDRRKIAEQSRAYLKKVGLELSPTTPLSSVSIAQQQLVEIAKALSVNARVIIMDEPTSCLTLTETNRLLKLIQELKSSGVSVVYISHRLMVGRNLDLKKSTTRNGDRENRIEIRDIVSPFFPSHKVSFDLRKGEILGLAGLVGAGRSELAMTIFGIVKPLAGEISINNQRVNIRSPTDGIQNGIYLVPEDRRKTGLITSMTVRENVTLPDLWSYVTWGLVSYKRELVSAEAQRQKLSIKTASTNTQAKNLSGGNQQKVVLAKWLSLQPKLIIFDEPTRGVDVGSKAEIYRLMRGLSDAGVFILMISSDMEEVLRVSARIAVMREGMLTGSIEANDFSEENVMKLAVAPVRTALELAS